MATKAVAMVDPHVHLRDWDQADKETLQHGFDLAWRLGFSALFEMPNTSPPLTSGKTILRRIEVADATLSRLGIPLVHGIYAGLTDSPAQIDSVVALYDELFPRIVGFKLYAGHSTGRMGVVDEEQQADVWQRLVRSDYRGVVAVHCEDETLLRPDLWDPTNPVSHGAARPAVAEVASVRNQIRLAASAGFRGSLHICHVSHPDSLAVITAARRQTPFALRCGVTPHHVLLDEKLARLSDVPEWKLNPPLRDEGARAQLEEALIAGCIDWIESDHAPHTFADKRDGASGLPGLSATRLLIERLRELGCSEELLGDLVWRNVWTAFGLAPDDLPENPNSPLSAGDEPFDYSAFAGEYEWDPYRYYERK